MPIESKYRKIPPIKLPEPIYKSVLIIFFTAESRRRKNAKISTYQHSNIRTFKLPNPINFTAETLRRKDAKISTYQHSNIPTYELSNFLTSSLYKLYKLYELYKLSN